MWWNVVFSRTKPAETVVFELLTSLFFLQTGNYRKKWLIAETLEKKYQLCIHDLLIGSPHTRWLIMLCLLCSFLWAGMVKIICISEPLLKNDHAHLYKLFLFPTNWIIITLSSSYGVYLIFLFIIDLKITSVFMKNSFNTEI